MLRILSTRFEARAELTRGVAILGADVVVIGGGPAGSALALAVARRGLSVTLLEREATIGPRVGETLPPSARPALEELGLWSQFQAGPHLGSSGITSCWGDDSPVEKDFIFGPHGCGWHLDRPAFDGMLLDFAALAGAKVLMGVAVRTLGRTSDGLWTLTLDGAGGRAEETARFVVLATGRSFPPGAAPAPRFRLDRLVGIVGTFLLAEGGPHWPRRLLLEAVPGGWWYSVPLPGARGVAAFMTDADLVSPSVKETFDSALKSAPHTTERLRGCVAVGALRAYPSDAGRASVIAGDGWLSIGDAAMSWDPLSGRGILKALEAALIAADAIAAALDGARDPIDGYAARIAAEFDDYRRRWADAYGNERRWPDARFWSRRHAAIAGVLGPLRRGERGRTGVGLGYAPRRAPGNIKPPLSSLGTYANQSVYSIDTKGRCHACHSNYGDVLLLDNPRPVSDDQSGRG